MLHMLLSLQLSKSSLFKSPCIHYVCISNDTNRRFKKKKNLFVMLINVFFRYTPKMSDIAVVNFQIFKLYMGVKELMSIAINWQPSKLGVKLGHETIINISGDLNASSDSIAVTDVGGTGVDRGGGGGSGCIVVESRWQQLDW